MEVVQANENSEIAKIILHHKDDHLVCPAWISKKSSLVMCAEQILSYPQFEGRVPGVSGLAGRTYGNSTNPWHKLWSLCDQVNDHFESGTLLPEYRITLLPAFTVTFGFDEKKAAAAVRDVFEAHKSFCSDKNIVILLSFGRNLRSKLEPWVKDAFSHSNYNVKLVFPPVDSDCHWSAA